MARNHGVAFLLALAIAVVAFAPGQSAAQESDGSPQADPCAHAADGEVMWAADEAMWTCRHEQLDRSEADLTAMVGGLITGYGDDPERVGALKEAHDTWLRFRDAECKLLTIDSASGTMFDLYWTRCLTEQNVKRIAQMQWLVDHP